jgi:hypothetical protein
MTPRAVIAVVLLAVGALALAGCDIPTALPVVETTWSVPVEQDSLAVAALLPDGVTAERGAFGMRAAAATGTVSLGALCAECAAAAGAPLPKPAFGGELRSAIALPGAVGGATLAAGGSVRIRLTNGFDFDPIRPGAGAGSARGRLVLQVRALGGVLAADTLDGAATALPAGATVERVLALRGGATVGPALEIVVGVESPAGDSARMRPGDALTALATPENLGASEARVLVDRRVVSLISAPFAFDAVGADVRARLQGASLVIDLAGPIAVAGTLAVRLLRVDTAEPLAAEKTLALTGADARVSLELDAAEIGRVLDAGRVALRIAGEVSGTAPDRMVTVTPEQALHFAPRLVLHTRSGD